MPDDHAQRLARALVSLEGLSVGDALGGFFEFTGGAALRRVLADHSLPRGVWHWTDDTAMAAAVVACLRAHGGIDQDWLAQRFAHGYQRSRGYGPTTRAVLARIRVGQSWREAGATAFGGRGSYGNGGAMRAAPLGAYFADDLAALAEHSRRAAEITHAHPEGVAGALAVALGAAQAANGAPQDRPGFLDGIVGCLPPGAVRSGIAIARDLPAGITPAAAAAILGNGQKISAQDTAPFALWCAAGHLGDYEAAIWATLAGGGDCDTTCAIVGGIVALATGADAIPQSWRAAREPLPAE